MNKITEKEWNENGIDLIKKYGLENVMDYFAFVEMPRIKKVEDEKREKLKKIYYDK